MKNTSITTPGNLPDRDQLKRIGAGLIPVKQEKLNQKMKELLEVSDQEVPRKDFFKSLQAKMKKQDELMEEIKILARELGTVQGRILQFPRGDGYALYMVSKVNKRTARVVWIDYGDAWTDQRVEDNPNLSLDYVIRVTKGRDEVDRLFGGK
jgi:hypothetical protein